MLNILFLYFNILFTLHIYSCASLYLQILLRINYFKNILFFFLASPYGKTKRQRWTEKEKETVLEAFSIHMKNLTLPSLQEIQQAKQNYSCLLRRTSP